MENNFSAAIYSKGNTKLNCLSEYDLSLLNDEFQSKHERLRKRHTRELYNLLTEYVFKRYSLKVGTVIKVKDENGGGFMVIDWIANTNTNPELFFKRPVIALYGHMVDKDGFDLAAPLSTSKALNNRRFMPWEISEICNISPKGTFRTVENI